MANAGYYEVLLTMLPVVDPETKKKKRYRQGDKVWLSEEQAERFMPEDPPAEYIHPQAVRPWRDEESDLKSGANQDEVDVVMSSRAKK